MKITFRKATIDDAQLYFDWANDITVRKNSFKQTKISYADHVNWFTKKLNSPDCFFYLFIEENNIPVGQVRIDKSGNEIVIGISIDENFRGKGFGVDMLKQACADYLNNFPNAQIVAYVKKENEASLKLFTKAGFIKFDERTIEGSNSFIFKKTKE